MPSLSAGLYPLLQLSIRFMKHDGVFKIHATEFYDGGAFLFFQHHSKIRISLIEILIEKNPNTDVPVLSFLALQGRNNLLRRSSVRILGNKNHSSVRRTQKSIQKLNIVHLRSSFAYNQNRKIHVLSPFDSQYRTKRFGTRLIPDRSYGKLVPFSPIYTKGDGMAS